MARESRFQKFYQMTDSHVGLSLLMIYGSDYLEDTASHTPGHVSHWFICSIYWPLRAHMHNNTILMIEKFIPLLSATISLDIMAHITLHQPFLTRSCFSAARLHARLFHTYSSKKCRRTSGSVYALEGLTCLFAIIAKYFDFEITPHNKATKLRREDRVIYFPFSFHWRQI